MITGHGHTYYSVIHQIPRVITLLYSRANNTILLLFM